MDYLNFDIVKDDYPQALEEYEKGNRSWLLVNCKVNYGGEIHNWALHFDEYMHRRLYKQLQEMSHYPVPSSIVKQVKKEIEYWIQEIKEREQAEDDAGEDL